MAEQSSLMKTLRDLVPFGKEYNTPSMRKDLVDAPYAHGHQRDSEDYASEESMQRYRQYQVAVAAQTNFLDTVGGYLKLITIALGTMAFLLFAATTPLVAVLPQAAELGAAAGAWLFPVAAAAVVSAVTTLAVGQYSTRLATEKNVDHIDWYQHRTSHIVGKAVAHELEPYLQRRDDRSWAQSVGGQRAHHDNWKETVRDSQQATHAEHQAEATR